MVLFKKRTSKESGRQIARDLQDIKRKQKLVRTLQKEEEIRERKKQVQQQIKQLKAKRPSFLKKIRKGGRVVGRVVVAGSKGVVKASRNFQENTAKQRVLQRKRSKKSRKKSRTQAPRQQEDFLDFVKRF